MLWPYVSTVTAFLAEPFNAAIVSVFLALYAAPGRTALGADVLATDLAQLNGVSSNLIVHSHRDYVTA